MSCWYNTDTRGPSTGPAGDPHPAPTEPQRSRRLGPVLVGVLALVLALGAALLFLDLDGTSETPSAESSPDTTASQEDTPSEEPTPTEGEEQQGQEEPEPSPEPTTSSAAPDEGAVAFIERYFATVPEDTDTGWSMLGPGGKSVGRDSYEGWWDSVEDVRVSDIEPAGSGETADVTLTYTMKDGRVETERQRLDLLRSESGWLINGDENI